MSRWRSVAGQTGYSTTERRDPSASRPSFVRTVVRAAAILVLCLATVTAAAPVAAETAGSAETIHVKPAAGDPATTEPGTDCGVATDATESTTSHRIVELYPNPPTNGNVGEYLVVESPPNATPSLTVSDGHSSATIAADRPAGRVAVSLDPNATEPLTEYPVVELAGHLRLAATGEELTLSTDGDEIDAVRYDDAPEGEIWYRSPASNAAASDDAAGTDGGSTAGPSIHRGEWWPQDGTCRPVASFDVDSVTTFVLPDSPSAVDSVLASADDRIKVAGYTFTDPDTRDDLLDALDRGVTVEILVERSPVGGMPAATAEILTELDEAGATVRVVGGEADRYAFHHPKYTVVDDRVLVTTENWKPAGVGGAASRGWGVVVPDAALADELGAVFDADATGYDAVPWSAARPRITFADPEPPANGSFAGTHDPATADVEAVELLLAPDNAGDRLETLIEEADESVRIVQVQVGGPDFRLLEAALEAARRGVEVELLLDASWYVAEDNRDLADRLETAAEREDVPIEVRLADGGERFERIHAKGMVIDDEIAVLGSLNWNDNAVGANREVVLVLHGSEAATYYAGVFDADWAERSRPAVPVTLGLAVVAGLGAAALAGRRYLRFSPASESDPSPVTIDATDGVRPPGDRGDERDDAGT